MKDPRPSAPTPPSPSSIPAPSTTLLLPNRPGASVPPASPSPPASHAQPGSLASLWSAQPNPSAAAEAPLPSASHPASGINGRGGQQQQKQMPRPASAPVIAAATGPPGKKGGKGGKGKAAAAAAAVAVPQSLVAEVASAPMPPNFAFSPQQIQAAAATSASPLAVSSGASPYGSRPGSTLPRGALGGGGTSRRPEEPIADKVQRLRRAAEAEIVREGPRRSEQVCLWRLGLEALAVAAAHLFEVMSLGMGRAG